jgi:hypothetical protein
MIETLAGLSQALQELREGLPVMTDAVDLCPAAEVRAAFDSDPNMVQCLRRAAQAMEAVAPLFQELRLKLIRRHAAIKAGDAASCE